MVIDGDTHLSKWIETTGLIDHGQQLEPRWSMFARPGDTVVDVGANVGDTTVPLARLVGRTGRVYALEPNPLAFDCLLHNVARADVAHQTIALPVGAGGTESYNVPFCVSPNVGASFIAPGNEDNKGVRIHLITLDSLWLTRCSFLKVDVEGFESHVLDGAKETIARCRPVIQLELAVHSNKYGVDRVSIAQSLIALGYKADTSLGAIAKAPQLDVLFFPA